MPTAATAAPSPDPPWQSLYAGWKHSALLYFSALCSACVCALCAANEVKSSAAKVGYVYQSTGCDSFYWQRVGRKVGRRHTCSCFPVQQRMGWL